MRGIENNVKVYVIDSSFSPTLSDAPSVNVVVDGSGNPTILIGSGTMGRPPDGGPIERPSQGFVVADRHDGYEVLQMDEEAPIGPNSFRGHQMVISEKHANDSIGKESM
ncbi:hypothetical protein V6N12_062493 [Hibiscus sabdariffa]|uniref:Dirigent protein n=1 Tax=Hibiscus sabdariffa TaxID=183260 RepID=A0ABR2F918_9ROSI